MLQYQHQLRQKVSRSHAASLSGLVWRRGQDWLWDFIYRTVSRLARMRLLPMLI